MSVESSLKAFGITQVIVTLKAAPVGSSAGLMASAGAELKHVTKHFCHSEDSPEGAMALEAGPNSAKPAHS